METKFVTSSELINILNTMTKNIKGQYVTITMRKGVKLNVFPTDGSVRERIDAMYKKDSKTDSAFVAESTISFHYSQDYERAMRKALNDETFVKGADTNRETLVPNVLMRYKSTNNVCFIYIAEKYLESKVTFNGRELTDDEKAIIARYKTPSKPSTINYRNVSWDKIVKIVIDKVEYRPINSINQVPIAV